MKRKKIVNVIVIIIGVLLLLTGLGKQFGTIVNGNGMSMVYVVIFNYLAGASLIFHGASTWNFKRSHKEPSLAEDLIDAEVGHRKGSRYKGMIPMNRLQTLTGIVAILSSAWSMIEILMIVPAFLQNLSATWWMLAIYLLIVLPFYVFPMVLTSWNISLSNDIASYMAKVESAKKRKEIKQKLGNKTGVGRR